LRGLSLLDCRIQKFNMKCEIERMEIIYTFYFFAFLKKVALFCCIPDADTSMNYLVGMIYSNLFQTLYYVADRKYGGRLPIPVHCIMDEWPNVALPDDFDKILATMRSRGISCSIIIQNIAQMKVVLWTLS